MPFAVIFMLCLMPKLGSLYSEDYIDVKNNIHHKTSLEKLQRIKHQHDRKERLDKFRMKRREAFIATPAFDMNALTFSKKRPVKRIEVLDEGHNVNYITDSELYRSDTQDQNAAISRSIQQEYDDYESIIKKRLYNDNKNPRYNSKEVMMDVVLRQNEMVAKLVELYQKEIDSRQFRDVLASVEQKNSKYLRDAEASDLATAKKDEEEDTEKKENEENAAGTKKDEHQNKEKDAKKSEKKDAKSKEKDGDTKKDVEKKVEKLANPTDDSTTGTNKPNRLPYITIDENKVKQKLLESPFVRRILKKLEKKKQRYISRREQEKELERNGWVQMRRTLRNPSR